MDTNKYLYSKRFEVRDYECDLQGIVNNANYLHYIEHTRHSFLNEVGLSFADLHTQGIDMVVTQVKIRYKHSLRPEDHFLSGLNYKQEGLKHVFTQDIINLKDQKLCARAQVEIIAVINGNIGHATEVEKKLQTYVDQIKTTLI